MNPPTPPSGESPMHRSSFMDYVSTHGPDECWPWTGSQNGRGYGRLNFEGYYDQAHRASWRIHRGEIPAGKNVLHTCDNTLCVNPNHLFLGNQQDNVDDCIAKGRFRAGSNPQRGEYSACALLNDDKVREIRRLLEEGHKHKDIAEWFNVARPTITNIAMGTRWRHVV